MNTSRTTRVTPFRVADVEEQHGRAILAAGGPLVHVLQGEAVDVDDGRGQPGALQHLQARGDQLLLGGDQHGLHLLLAVLDDLGQDVEAELDLVDVERDERLGLGGERGGELGLGQPRELHVAHDDRVAGEGGGRLLGLDALLDEQAAQRVDDRRLALLGSLLGAALGRDGDIAPRLQVRLAGLLLDEDDLHGVRADVDPDDVLGTEEQLAQGLEPLELRLDVFSLDGHFSLSSLRVAAAGR
jgi:hypothetical protein